MYIYFHVPQAIEDARNETNESTDSKSDFPLPPTVRIHTSSPLTLDVDNLERQRSDDRHHLGLDPFPDVIKSAESSPRHSLSSSNVYYARPNDPKEQKSKEIINQINEEISQAVRSGHSAYCLFGMYDDDEETWC